MGQNAVVGLPEFILVESLPNGPFFDVEYEFRFAFFELDHIRFDDGGDTVPAASHPGTIDFVPFVDDGDIADHIPFILGGQVQFFPERTKDHLDILDDRIALGLVVERFLFDPGDGAFEHVVETTNAVGFSLGNQLLRPAGDKHRLHETLRLGKVEQLPLRGFVPHFNDFFTLIEADVRKGPHRNIDDRVTLAIGDFRDPVRQLDDAREGLFVFVGKFGHL